MVEGLISREDGVMPAPGKYSDELCECAVRLVRGLLADAPGLSMTKARHQVGEQLGINGDSLRNWTKRERIDAGELPGTTSTDTKRIAELENRELRRANTILRQASAYFAQAEPGRR